MWNRRTHGALRRVLVIRFGAMGDVVLASPLIRGLSRAGKGVQIDFLVKEPYIPLVAGDPRIHRILSFPQCGGLDALRNAVRAVRANRYDAVVDLQNSPRSRAIACLSGAGKRRTVRLDRWKRFCLVHFRKDLYGEPVPVPLKYLRTARDLGAADDGLGLEFFVDPVSAGSMEGRLGAAGIDPETPLAVLAPGAGRRTKRWPVGRFADTATHFASRGFRTVLIGGPGDRTACDDVRRGAGGKPVDFSATLTLQETASLIQRARLLITNDTGVMHLAAALGTPCAAVFGPTTRQFGFFPFRARSAIVERALDCRPCSYHGTDRCPKGHFRCMLDIGSGDVISAAERILNSE
jgi:heptosyltransferase-2